MSISMRVSDAEKELIQKFAALYGMSVSDYIRTVVMEKIEDEFDLKAYEEAKAEFEKNPVTYTHEQVKKELGLE